MGDVFYANSNVTNFGFKNATAVNVSWSGCSGVASDLNGRGTKVILGNMGYFGNLPFSNTTANDGTNPSNATYNWKFNLTGTTDTTCALTFTTEAIGTKYDRNAFTINLRVSAASSGSPSPSPSPGDGGTGNKSLNITSFPLQLQIGQGNFQTAAVRVKNTGTIDLKPVNLTVAGIFSSWYTVVPPSQNISWGSSKDYTVTFTIPSDAEVSNYTITYKASGPGAEDSETGYLVVLPSVETAQKLRSNLTNTTNHFDIVMNLTNVTKKAGGNVSLVEPKLAKARQLLDDAETYLDAGQNFLAYTTLSDTESLLTEIENDLASIEENLAMSKSSNITLYGGILAAVIVLGLIAYAVFPKKPGFNLGGGYKHVPAEHIGKSRIEIATEKIKDFLRRIRERAPQRKEEYKYHP